MESAKQTRLLVIDDDENFHRFLRDLLDPARVEVTSCMNGTDGLGALKTCGFDLIICDYQLPDMLGLEALEWMRDHQISAPRVFVTGYATVDVAVKAMKLGATDLFTKPLADPPAFVRFLNRTLALDPPLPLPAEAAPPQPITPEEPSATDDQTHVEKMMAQMEPAVDLSRREREVLTQLLRGLSNKEIAATLHISERTVKNHATNIYRKFGVDSRPQLFNKIMRDR